MSHVLNYNHVSILSSKKGAKLLILLGFIILSIASYRAVLQYKFLDHATLTQGEIVGSQLSDYKNSEAIKMPVIKYFDKRGVIHYMLTNGSFFSDQNFKLHQKVPVAYDSYNVENAQIYMMFSPGYLNAIVFCMVAIGLVGIGMLFLFEDDSQKK
tara:strand:+ start:955 stop:1419 length:465 start_codon:yes stop_codon:yes gene_type:complete